MRRARLQIKPNLGPRGSTRPQPSTEVSSKPKPAPLATAARLPQSAPAATAQADGKADNFTQLKPSDSRLAEMPNPGAVTHAPAAQSSHPAAERTACDRSVQRSRSPRKSADVEQPRVSSSLAAVSQAKSDALGSGDPAHLSPVKVRSSRKSLSSDHLKTSESGASTASTRADKAHGDGAVMGARAGSPVKKMAAPVVKPTIMRQARSRFKVQPNLSEAGKRGQKSPAVEKKAPEPESTVQGQAAGQGHGVEHSSEVNSCKEVEGTHAPELTLTCDEISEDGGEPDTSVSDQPVSAMKVTWADEGGSEEGADDSDLGTLSQASSDRDTADGLRETSVEPDIFTSQEDRRKAAEEKKMRRLKPPLPSTETPPDRGKMKMSDLIYWNPSRNHMKRKEGKKEAQPSGSSSSIDTVDTASVTTADDEASSQSDSMPVPQLKVGPDGNIVLNTDSLVVDTQTADPMGADMETIEEDEDRFITCNSFRNNRHQKRWSQSETARFYKALSLVGTDFSLMCNLFPSRSRRDLKNKFSKEEKRNRPLIDQALRERQVFDRSTFEKAREEDEAEKRRQEAIEEEKKRRRNKRQMKLEAKAEEDEEEEEDREEDEEEVERRIYDEERKENSRKRNGGILNQDGSKFAAYAHKKAKRERPAPGHADEVVEILVNMSQGKVAADSKDLDDDMSDAASVASEQDAAVFIPRVVRPRAGVKPPRPLSSENVVVDSEVLIPDLTIPEDGDRVAGNLPAETIIKEANIVDYNQALFAGPEEAAVTQRGAVRVTASQSTAGQLGPNLRAPAPALDGGMLTGSASPQPAALMSDGHVVDISSFFERLQTQTSTPVDVVLVEQMGEGQQGLVHVYLVPRAASQAEGGEMDSRPNEGGEMKSMPNEGGEGNSAAIEGGERNGAPVEGGERNGTPIEGGERSSAPIEGGKRNSTPIEGGERNSALIEGGVGSSAPVEGGEGSSVPVKGSKRNCIKSKGGEGKNPPSYQGEGHSMQSVKNELSEVMVLCEEMVTSDQEDPLPAKDGS